MYGPTQEDAGDHSDAETDDGLPYFQDEKEQRRQGLEPYEKKEVPEGWDIIT